MSRKVSVVLAGLLTLVLAAGPSFALTDRWATWSPVAGSSNAFVLTMSQQSAGFPAAAVTSDSRAPVQLPTGASSFLGTATPPGATYGSSVGNPYLVLRPRADTPTAPSVTTYRFEAPTPDTGWAFVLGDIDADRVAVSATDATGATVPATEVDSWFRGTFNYVGDADLPTWDASTSTLTGNPGAADTEGASGWFEPDVRLTSLTMTFTRRAGFPSYQTWFVSRARPLGGTVQDLSTVGTCSLEAATLTLLSPFGRTLASTAPAADGTYTFGEFATQDGYLVRLQAPAGCVVLGPGEQVVSNRGADNAPPSRADFAVRAVVPQSISGPGDLPTASAGDVDLVLDKRSPGGAQAGFGMRVRFRLTVRNRGTDPASGPITVTDALPRGLELISARGTGWSCRPRLDLDKVTCVRSAGLRVRSKARDVLVVARATAAKRLVNVAKVRVAGERVRSNNRDVATVTVVPAVLPATGFRPDALG